MQAEHANSLARTKEMLQVYLNLPEILQKFDTEEAMKTYVEKVSQILNSEVDFVLRSGLTRSGGHRSPLDHRTDRKHHPGQPLHLQGELPAHFQPPQ